MTQSNHQYLERLAEVSRNLGKDEGLPDASRAMFAKAFDLADTSKNAFKNDNSLDQAFTLLCSACKTAGLDQCRDKQCGFLSCHLLWDYSC